MGEGKRRIPKSFGLSENQEDRILKIVLTRSWKCGNSFVCHTNTHPVELALPQKLIFICILFYLCHIFVCLCHFNSISTALKDALLRLVVEISI